MKKQFFSKLLMGALVFATVGFVSCKDYDDDISSLQAQINNAATVENLSSLQSRLDALTTSSEQNLKKAEEALKGNSDAQTVLAELKAAAEKAGQDAADAIKAAQAAKTTADEAATAAAKASAASKDAADAAAAAIAAQKGVDANSDEIKELKAQLEKFAAAQQTYTTQAALKEEIDALKKLIDDKIAAGEGFTGNISLTADQARILFGEVANSRFEIGAGTYSVQTVFDATIDSIDKIWGAVTSVSLYVTSSGTEHVLQNVSFLNTIEKFTGTFPAEEDLELTNNDKLDFTENHKVTYVDTIIVRVSPTNAQLSADMISLINSQGVEIDKELISVDNVAPYTRLLTRAESNNGLWKVALKLKDDYTKEEFNAVAESKHRNVLFAIAVNNTNDADRRIISEYGLNLYEGAILHAYDFMVDEESVANLRNRWTRCEDGTLTNTGDEKTHVNELTWKADAQVEATMDDNCADRYNGIVFGNDNRQAMPLYTAQKGEPIELNYRDLVNMPGSIQKPIRGFFVTLDWRFAQESSPSEINAWLSYDYDNVGKVYTDRQGKRQVMQPATLFRGNYGTITINDVKNVRGDIIGFRAFAVNYDGTLVDPDGRAFYVYVGEMPDDVELPVVASAAIDVPVTDGDDNYAIYELTAQDKAKMFSEEANSWTSPVWAEGNPYVAIYPSGTSFYAPVAESVVDFEERLNGTLTKIGRLGAAANTTGGVSYDGLFTITYGEAASDFEDGKATTQPSEKTNFVKVAINDPRAMVDNEIYKVVITGKLSKTTTGGDVIADVIQNVTIKIRKQLPERTPFDLIVKKNQENIVKDLQVYMKPVVDYSLVASGTAATNLWNLDNAPLVKYGIDIKPFDIADMYNNVLKDDQNTAYQRVKWDNWRFLFETSDINSAEKEVPTYSHVGMYELANSTSARAYPTTTYTVPWANQTKIDDQNNPVSHQVKALYDYIDLSLTEVNRAPQWNTITREKVLDGQNMKLANTTDAFKVSYICALEMNNFRKLGTKYDFVNGRYDNTGYDDNLWNVAYNKYDTKIEHDPDGVPGTGDEVAFGTSAYNSLTAAQKTAAQAAAKTAYNDLFVIAYEEAVHDIPLYALYFEQGQTFAKGWGYQQPNHNHKIDATHVLSTDYLGLTPETYALRTGYDNPSGNLRNPVAGTGLPVAAYMSEMIADNLIGITNVVLGNGLEHYYVPEIVTIYSALANVNVPTLRLKYYRSTLEPGLIEDLNGSVTLTITDVFGHEHDITFAITLRKPVLK
jgi:hypothetical protein